MTRITQIIAEITRVVGLMLGKCRCCVAAIENETKPDDDHDEYLSQFEWGVLVSCVVVIVGIVAAWKFRSLWGKGDDCKAS